MPNQTLPFETLALVAERTSAPVHPDALTRLPLVLSLIAGSVDAISFLGLSGLFAAHITGNLVVLTAHVAAGNPARTAAILAVPVFMTGLILVRLLTARLEAKGKGTLRPLLLLQFLFLAGFLCLTAGHQFDPEGARAILAGMLGISAMAVQNALVQVSLPGSPSTAVMTTNVTRFTMDVGDMLFGRSRASKIDTRARAMRTWPTILGFAAGCAAGAFCEVKFGLWALVLPVSLALLAFLMSCFADLHKTSSDADENMRALPKQLSFFHMHIIDSK